MKPFLKEIHSPDINLAGQAFVHEDSFCFLVQAKIGFDNTSNRGDIFNFSVCSPQWLLLQLEEYGPIWGYSLLVLDVVSYETLEKAINRVLDSIDQPNWEDAARQISRYAAWEFDGYRL